MSATEPSVPTSPPADPGIVSAGWLANSSFERREPKRVMNGLGISIALHAAIVGLIVAFIATNPDAVYDMQDRVIKMVYLDMAGPGGGGGGSPAPAPKKEMQIAAHKAPAPTPITPQVVEPPPPIPVPTLTAPIQTNAATIMQQTGASSVSLATFSGGGSGGGLGAGRGSGVGEGSGGGFGGGVYEMGAGINGPYLLKDFKPAYSAEAMRANIRGRVEVEAIVLEDGTVGSAKIKKSLDRVYGLDEKALEAVRQWLFKPGVDRDGKPVKVRVTILLDFALH